MSLKAFHVIFITAASLLAFGCGAWLLWSYDVAGLKSDLTYGIASLGIGLGLLVYEGFFLKKLKKVSYL